jgi:thiosulfate/3-mercaptopyruvate sulfurtransferase
MKSGFVSPVYLHNLLQQGGGKHPIVLEVSWNERASKYDKGHIPGAIYVNTDEVEYDLFKARVSTNAKDLRRSTTEVQDLAKGLTKEDTLPQNWWNIYPDRYLLPALAHIGVDVNSSVVVYGDDPNAASRLAWVMLYAGVRKVQVLDGGLQAWKRAGFEVSIVPVVRKSVKCFGTEKPRRSEYRVDLPGVRAEIGFNRADFVLADIRTKGEYAGRTTPYDYINTKGRIKGAHWGRAGTCRTTMESYLNENGTFKKMEEVETMWFKSGITRDKRVVFYCGTSWRSSLAFFFAYVMGWERISNFDGGWYDWSLGPEAAKNPCDFGDER